MTRMRSTHSKGRREEDRGGTMGEERERDIDKAAWKMKMLQAYRSKREDVGRGSLMLVFGGGENAWGRLLLSDEIGMKTWMVWRSDSFPIA